MKTRTISFRICCILFLFGLGLFPVEAKEKQPKKPLPEFPFKRFYIDASVGYGFGIASVPLTGDWENPYGGINIWDGLPPNGDCSLTRGIHVGLNFGHRFNKYLAFDVGGKYMAYINTDQVAYTEASNRTHDSLSDMTIDHREIVRLVDLRSVSGQIGQISVQLVASPGFARVDPYVKAGFLFTVGKIFADQTLSTYLNQNFAQPIYTQNYGLTEWTFRVGFAGAIGMNIHITPSISTFFEWQFSVSGFHYLCWTDLQLESETGDKETANGLIHSQRYTGRDHISFNSHGLNIGVKFKF